MHRVLTFFGICLKFKFKKMSTQISIWLKDVIYLKYWHNITLKQKRNCLLPDTFYFNNQKSVRWELNILWVTHLLSIQLRAVVKQKAVCFVVYLVMITKATPLQFALKSVITSFFANLNKIYPLQSLNAGQREHFI